MRISHYLFWAVSALSTSAADIAREADVLMRVDQSISTKSSKAGDLIHLRTASPLTIGGRAVPIDSVARGRVAVSKRAGEYRGHAQLAIDIDSIVLPDGTMLAVTAAASSNETQSAGARRKQGHPNTLITIGLAALAALTAAGITDSALNRGEVSDEGAGVGSGTFWGIVILRHAAVRGDDLELREGTLINVAFDNTGIQ